VEENAPYRRKNAEQEENLVADQRPNKIYGVYKQRPASGQKHEYTVASKYRS
jgi:hypothetical protein